MTWSLDNGDILWACHAFLHLRGYVTCIVCIKNTSYARFTTHARIVTGRKWFFFYPVSNRGMIFKYKSDYISLRWIWFCNDQAGKSYAANSPPPPPPAKWFCMPQDKQVLPHAGHFNLFQAQACVFGTKLAANLSFVSRTRFPVIVLLEGDQKTNVICQKLRSLQGQQGHPMRKLKQHTFK